MKHYGQKRTKIRVLLQIQEWQMAPEKFFFKDFFMFLMTGHSL
jgi:hypothetical protein